MRWSQKKKREIPVAIPPLQAASPRHCRAGREKCSWNRIGNFDVTLAWSCVTINLDWSFYCLRVSEKAMAPKHPSCRLTGCEGRIKLGCILILSSPAHSRARLYLILEGLRMQSFASLAFSICMTSRAARGS